MILISSGTGALPVPPAVGSNSLVGESPLARSEFQRKPAFVFLLLFIGAFCVAQGYRFSGIPLPSFVPLCIFYVAMMLPPVRMGAVFVYGAVVVYIAIVSTRNALSLTGSVKDFLYVGICLITFLLYYVLSDIVETLPRRVLGLMLLAVALGESALQLVQYLDVGHFNEIFHGVLNYYASQVNGEGFLEFLHLRTPATFGSPTLAAFIIYMLFRTSAILLARPWITYMTIVPLICGGARTATLLFVLWEFVIPVFISRRRGLAFIGLVVMLIAVYSTFQAFPSLFKDVFLFSAFDVRSPFQLLNNYSIVNRLDSFAWAFDHPFEFFTFGGVTAAQFAARETAVFAIDSEMVLRSMQFGMIGFIGFVWMSLWPGFSIRDRNWWFLVVLVFIASLTNSLTTQFMSLPFLLLYSISVRRVREAGKGSP
jgi:hypothetical protein